MPRDPTQPDASGTAQTDTLIARWRDREGGQERANFPLFFLELCDALDLPRPDPAGPATALNDYVFERRLDRPERDGTITHPRMDLYKRGCFILEAKQSRAGTGAAGQLAIRGLPAAPPRAPGRGWDVLMLRARRQAEQYLPLLPASHDPPPFLVVCDVGRCFEVYANFRRDGKVYHPFPDRRGFRIGLDDLRRPEVRDRLRAIWQDPMSLNPAREAARVTRAFAEAAAELEFAPGAARIAASSPKARFPADDVGQTAMVYAALARATGALDAKAIASRFRQGKRVAPKVSAVLSALHRLGVVGTGDGRSFALPHAG